MKFRNLSAVLVAGFAINGLVANHAIAEARSCVELFHGSEGKIAFEISKDLKSLRLDWGAHAESLRGKLKSLGIDENAVKFRIVKNGDRLPQVFDWKTRTFDMPMPKEQTDFYVEIEYGSPAKTIYRSYVMIKENFDAQSVKASSFAGLLKRSALKVDLPKAVLDHGYDGSLGKVALEKGYEKISWVVRPTAAPELRQLLADHAGSVDVEVVMNDQGEPLSAIVTDKNSGHKLMEAGADQFYFKLDAAFSGNSFFWDDMLVSLATVSSHPWLVRSTIEFWLDVQNANGGVIPREVRKGNLKSLFFPDVIELGEEPKSNLTYTNPYLIDWVAEELYSYDPSPKNLALLKRISKSVDDYSDWMYKNRSVHDANGKWIGFTTNSLASGLDNSRGERGNDFTKSSYQSAWVDVLAQQISMFKSSAKWNQRFADDLSATASERALYKAKSVALAEKARRLDAHLNKNHWNEELGFYFDLIPDGHGAYVQDTKYTSIAGFWPLYSKSVPQKQLRRLIETQMSPSHFGGEFPLPANSRHTLVGTDPEEDGYWDMRGHWPSMAAVVVEGFHRHGQTKLASEIATCFLKGMQEAAPTTVAEFYGEHFDAKGVIHARVGKHGHHQTRLDFAGWGKLPPLYFSIRHNLGLEPQADGRVRWNLPVELGLGEKVGAHNLDLHGEKIEIFLKRDHDGNYSIESSAKKPLMIDLFVQGKPVQQSTDLKSSQLPVAN